MRSSFVLLTISFSLAFGGSVSAETRSDVTTCDGSGALVRAATPQEAELACAGVADALSFFRAYGFDTDVEIDITVLESVRASGSENLSYPVLGQFRPDINRVFLTSLASQRAMARKKQAFKQPFDPRQFREVAAHETAHIIAEHNFRMAEPSRLLHEYVAYIVQLSTTEPARRMRILAAFNTEPFESPYDINPIIYGVAPTMFAVKAYLYFETRPDRKAYLEEIMVRDLPGASYTLDLFG